jgi:superfamily II DNA or RNA helicase
MTARDNRRIFSDAQKAELLEAASYRCQGDKCPNPDLSDGQAYQFHHEKRHADGGLTSVFNGRVLCVPCHRNITAPTVYDNLRSVWDSLRRWQQDALTRFVESDEQRIFVLEAAPGAGKTLFAACASRFELDSHSDIMHVICIAPWKPIIASMRKAFGKLEMDVRDKFHYDKKRGCLQLPPQGDVTLDTYAGFCNEQTVNVLKAWQAKYGFRFMLILDEVHHTNALDGKWGPYATEIAEMASKLVVMSGTYFRSDRKAISFLEYTDDGPRVDYQITYPECIANRYVRQVAFRYCDPVLSVFRNMQKNCKSYQPSKIPKGAFKLLATAKRELLHPKGEHVAWMINEAWKELQRFRSKWPDAACLVVCQSGTNESEERAIHEVAKRIRDITGQTAVVVTSDDAASHGRLSAFSEDGCRDAFLCAIRMVSEGVDIPRIRVVLFLSYTDSEMLFRQIVGRGLRYIEGKEDDTAALVVLPRFPVMAEFAERFQDEVAIGAADIKTTLPEPTKGTGEGESLSICKKCMESPCRCYVVIGSEAGSAGGIFADAYVPEKFIQRAKLIADSNRSHEHVNVVQMGDFLHKAATIDDSPIDIDSESSKELHLRNVKNIVEKIARFHYGGEIGQAWVEEVHRPYYVTSIDEIRGTWKASQIKELERSMRDRFLEVLTHG